MNGKSDGYIEDPTFEEFDGCYIGVENPPKLKHNLQAIARYLKANNMELKDLSEEKLNEFKL